MTCSEPARTTPRPLPRILIAGLLVVIAVIAAIALALGYPLLASSSSTAASPIDRCWGQGEAQGAAAAAGLASLGRDGRAHPRPSQAPRPAGHPARPHQRSIEARAARDEADGAVPDGTTVFDGEIPSVANLDPALLGALRQAATDAAHDSVEFFLDSGWRSPEYQSQLLREAICEYGSEKQIARWVATPTSSAHVSGDAVDIGPFDATARLPKFGAEYGLCQIYRNEPWLYKLRPVAIDHG